MPVHSHTLGVDALLHRPTLESCDKILFQGSPGCVGSVCTPQAPFEIPRYG